VISSSLPTYLGTLSTARLRRFGGPPHKATPRESPRASALSTAGPDAGLRPDERKGRESDPLFSADAALALPDAALRTDPPAAGALRSLLGCRAPLFRKNLRINADEATPHDLRFAVGTRSGPRPSCRSGAMAPAGRAASTQARICDAGARLDLAVDSNGLATSLKACAREADPVSAAAKAAALTCSAAPNAPAAGDEILALGRSTWSSPFGCAGGGPFR
jgi:hypothetical protein